VDERELVRAAEELLIQHYREGWHHVACVLQCGSKLYPALHLDSSGYDVCAEPVAIANAVLAGESQFDRIVAVAAFDSVESTPRIVPPCGDCRQLLHKFAPDLRVLIDVNGQLMSPKARDLLPYAYVKGA
jgi:cytidine deaminase